MCSKTEAGEARDRRSAAIDRFAALSAAPLPASDPADHPLRTLFAVDLRLPVDMAALLHRIGGGPKAKEGGTQ